MTYKVLLVDDENWVVESLKASVDWTAHGFEVIGTASNGNEALEIMHESMPDVVFLDIRMPGMNGLELLKKGSELPYLVQFIVVSGYAEFAYAQKALMYGALAYCLKPFDEQEIIGVLKKAKKNIEAFRRSPEGSLLSLLEEPNEENKIFLIEELKKNKIDGGFENGLGVFVCSISSKKWIRPFEQSLSIKIGNSKYLFIVAWEQLEKALEHFSSWLADDIRGIGVSGKVKDMKSLKVMIERANILADQYYIYGKPAVFREKLAQEEQLNDVIRKIDAAIRTGDMAAANRAFDQVSFLFKNGGFTIRHALHLYNIVHSFLYRIVAETSESMLYSYELMLSSFVDFADMIHYLRQLVGKNILKAPEYGSQETSNETFNAILQYINLNYIHDLSIQSLSQQFFINPSYISQLFKREIGETFTAYIAKLRIMHACDLLENTYLMVGEVAEKSGYPDYFYFTKIFKKVTGKTPTQFRLDVR